MYKMVFLDTTSTLKDVEVKFSLHTKPTDSHLYQSIYKWAATLPIFLKEFLTD